MVSRKSEILDELFEIIETRKHGDDEASYTAKLFSKGPAIIGRKLNEESVEALIAAAQDNPSELAQEAADVIYHLLVLLASLDVSLGEVLDVLAKRQGVSGLEEKASRRAAEHKGFSKGD